MGNLKDKASEAPGGADRARAGTSNQAELYTLGNVRLLHRGEDLTAKLGPKHLALLVYLFHELRPMHPSEVTDLLGRGQEAEREIEALRRAVTWLRNNVPGVNIRMSADTVEAIGGVWVDTKDVDSAIDGDDPGHVAELYLGEFLEGFESGSRAYDEWARRERGRLKRAWSHAMISAARRSEKRGRWDGAAQWWQVLVDRAPMRPEPVAGLLRAYASSDREQEAAGAYADYLSRLQQSGVSKPAAQVAQVVESYKFLSRVETGEGVAEDTAEPAKAARPEPKKPAEAEDAPKPVRAADEGLPGIPGFQPGAAIVADSPGDPKRRGQEPAASAPSARSAEGVAAGTEASPDDQWEKLVDLSTANDLDIQVPEPPAVAPQKPDAKAPAVKPPAASKPSAAKPPAASKPPAAAKPAKPPAEAVKPAAASKPAPAAKASAPSKPPPKKVDLDLPGSAAEKKKRPVSGTKGSRDGGASTTEQIPFGPLGPDLGRSDDDDALSEERPRRKPPAERQYRPVLHEVTSVRKPWGPFLRQTWDELGPWRAEASRVTVAAGKASAAGIAKVPGITLRILTVIGRFVRAAARVVWRLIAGAGRAIGRFFRAIGRGVRALVGGVWAGITGTFRLLGRGVWAVLRSVTVVGRLFGAGSRRVAGAASRAASGGRRAGKARLEAARARRDQRRAAKAKKAAVVEPIRRPAPPRRKKRKAPSPAAGGKVEPAAPPVREKAKAPSRPAAEPTAPATAGLAGPTPASPALQGRVKARHWFRAAGRTRARQAQPARRPRLGRALLFAPAALALAVVGFFFGPDLYRAVRGAGELLPAAVPDVEAPSLPKVTLPKVTVPKVAVPNVAVKTPAFVETSVSKIAEVLAGPLLPSPGQWVLVSDVGVSERVAPASESGATPSAEGSAGEESPAAAGPPGVQASRVSGGAAEYSLAALTVALQADLVQASYFRVVPRERALLSAGRLGGGGSEELPVAQALAVARADGYAAVLDARLLVGQAVDSIALQVLSPAGDTLYGVVAAVSDSIDALATLTGLAHTVRRRLGESRDGVERSLAPARSLTNSPSALNAYAEAKRHFFAGRHYYAVQAAREAVERDSTFAMAYRLMAEAYALRGQRSQSRAALEAAYLLSERLTERERLRIAADRLAWDGQLSDAVLAYDDLFKRYRDDVGALRSQAVVQRMVGARGRGEGNLRVAYMIDPLDWPPLSGVARYLGYYGRLPDVDSLVAALEEEPALP